MDLRQRSKKKFDCPYFTIQSDTVTHLGGDHRLYNRIRMKNVGIAVVPIDNDGSTTLIGQYRYALTASREVTRGMADDGTHHPSTPPNANSSEETAAAADHWLNSSRLSASPRTSDATCRASSLGPS